MARVISKPGPPPTSCITCRRRRKKCDMARPSCERCLKGGYECLGYENPVSRVIIHRRSADDSTHYPKDIKILETVDPAVVRLPQETNINLDQGARPSTLEAAMLYGVNGPVSSDQSQSIIRPYYTRNATQVLNTNSDSGTSSNGLTQIVEALCRSVPPSIDVARTMRGDYRNRVVHTYYTQRLIYWFHPPSVELFSPELVQLAESKRIVWVMYLGAKAFELLQQGAQAQSMAIAQCLGWVNQLEHKFTTNSRSDPSSDDTGKRLMAHLELATTKFNLVNTTSGYQLLRNALPKFLQLAAADTNLIVEQLDGSLTISFPRTLRAPRIELIRFVMHDAMLSFLLGLPPLVEYGYDCEYDSKYSGYEWSYGIPVALLQIVTQVSSYRAGSRASIEDWKTLEMRVLNWKSQYSIMQGTSATESVTRKRVVVQEGWRHVTLIYIYMGMCGVSSHDTRIQASVGRILQLGELLGSSPISVHTLPHCVVAGLAARLEKQRIAVYEHLRSIKSERVWLFPGSQFSEILYHLWHGVGLGGASVTWDDYVRSRCAIAPIQGDL
ncbi:GAL4-like Zn(II)2Cys6 (or C6 zinc) binuclear cluster DNA-binding domain [Rhizoctonia solani]|uniref:GAL4-like Zn(II)2Cys6 (Or C6 zinc) binuclear cluster DNA-binding domain n=1 Tax=Rhizoctonia solani TaxID=456999 RepID=A0A8H7I6U0_9AGAM|nr:GAL4-like Zn(II)2Cys6 (or C6 zinc) binuclear cluster DNA-binding domain [Rhizoctonia solani]